MNEEPDPETARLMTGVGARMRAARAAAAMSRKALASRADVSERYLAEVEAGRGNISAALLFRVARALGAKAAAFLDEGARDGDRAETERLIALFEAADEATRLKAIDVLAAASPSLRRARRIGLIGLRGAGKSSLGRRLGAALDLPFVELNREIEREAGMGVGDVIALYGTGAYRKMERSALERAADAHDAMVLAVAGGVVDAPDNYEIMLARFHTVWLRAAPEEHMARVRAQGDERPMAGVPEAMEELRRILAARTAHYARAEAVLDTSGRDFEESAAALTKLARDAFGVG